MTAQVHNSNSQWRLCHTSCELLDVGLLSDWLGSIKTWMDQNPDEGTSIASRKYAVTHSPHRSGHNPPRQFRRRNCLRTQHRIHYCQHHRLRVPANLTHVPTHLMANPTINDRRRKTSRRLRGLLNCRHQLSLPHGRIYFCLGEPIRRNFSVQFLLRAKPTLLAVWSALNSSLIRPSPAYEPFPLLRGSFLLWDRVSKRELCLHDQRAERRNREFG